MTTGRDQRLEHLFNEALDLSAAERPRFLNRTCGDDETLRQELASLLDAHGASRRFLDAPAAQWEFPEGTGADLPAAVGTVIGKYRLLRPIASGGMGTVYEGARADDSFDHRVAVKLLRRGVLTPAMRRRFHVERQTLANLEHPFITRLIDGGATEDQLPYLVMEYVDGQSIDRYCDENRLSIQDRLRLFRKVCEAVHAAHQNLIIHRDLKPANILVNANGDPKLLDFGIAKLLDDAGRGRDATVTTLRAMTPRYASPEQVRNLPTTTQSDLYSLGVVLYELLTGHRPYSLNARSDAERERIVCERDPTTPSVVIRQATDIVATGTDDTPATPEHIGALRGDDLAQLRRKLSGDLDNIVLMALQKDPARRYRSVEQFSEDIGRYLRGLPVLARKDTLAYRGSKLIQRNKPVFAALALLAIAMVLGVLGTSSGWIRARRAQEMAQHERNTAVAAQADAVAVTGYMQQMLSAANPFRRGRHATVIELLADAEERIAHDLADKPSVQAGVRFALGHSYAGMWQWDPAARNLRIALNLYRQTGEPRSEEIAKCLTLLGRAMTFARSAESVELQEQAVAIRRELFGDDDPRTAETKGNLGYALWHGVAPARFDEAEPLYREAIGVLQQAPSEYRADEARFTFSLGVMLMVADRLEESGDWLRHALEIYRQLPVREDRYMVECMRHYAQQLISVGRLDEAEAMLIETLDATPLGTIGYTARGTAGLLGRAYMKADRYADAERVLLTSLARSCDNAAVVHPTEADELGRLAHLIDPRRTPDAHQRPVADAFALLRRLEWLSQPDATASMADLAECMRRTGRPHDGDALRHPQPASAPPPTDTARR